MRERTSPTLMSCWRNRKTSSRMLMPSLSSQKRIERRWPRSAGESEVFIEPAAAGGSIPCARRRAGAAGRGRRRPADRVACGTRFVVSYRTPLESRLAKKVTKAIVEHRLIEDGDRVMVGLSGGKDSWALMQILDELRPRAPIDFSLVAVNINSGYTNFRHDLVTGTCAQRGWEVRVEHTTIGAVIEDILDDGETPCSLCARLRRGVLYRVAALVGATKI